MTKTLNFNKLKKSHLTITLADEKETTLMIGTPTKTIMNELKNLQADDGEENLDELYRVCAKVMSHNKTGIVISAEQLEELFDYEDIVIFFNSYTDFIDEITNEKN